MKWEKLWYSNLVGKNTTLIASHAREYLDYTIVTTDYTLTIPSASAKDGTVFYNRFLASI